MNLRYDSVSLARSLAEMAGIDFNLVPIKRMVLVLDCEDAPQLFIETRVKSGRDLAKVKIEPEQVVISDQPIVVGEDLKVEVEEQPHSPECGTRYRGCAPDCPKDLAERVGQEVEVNTVGFYTPRLGE